MKKRTSKILMIICLACVLGYGVWFHFFRQPTVSVVMPVYNRADLVSRAIKSILEQTFTDFEFIIVDDGSSDKTPEILKNYAATDSRIKILTNVVNMGIAYSRNRGMQAARGKYIAVMDSDDVSVPERLAKSVRFFKEHPETDALTGHLLAVEDGQKVFPSPKENAPGDHYIISHNPGFYEIDLFFYNNFPNIASMIKRSFIQEHALAYKLTLISAEDYDFWVQVARNGGKLASLKDVLGYVRYHNSNSDNYYDSLIKNSEKIHYEVFSQFFKPTKEEILFEYTTFDKCPILEKMIEANAKKHIISQTDLKAYAATICPKSKTYIKLNHPNWKAFLEKKGEDKWKRTDTEDEAKVIFSEKKVRVLWDHWPEEDFIGSEKENEYIYMPHEESFEVSHPYWKDKIWYSPIARLCCREAVHDCGECYFTKEKDHLQIKWKEYAAEEFKRTGDKMYELILQEKAKS